MRICPYYALVCSWSDINRCSSCWYSQEISQVPCVGIGASLGPHWLHSYSVACVCPCWPWIQDMPIVLSQDLDAGPTLSSRRSCRPSTWLIWSTVSAWCCASGHSWGYMWSFCCFGKEVVWYQRTPWQLAHWNGVLCLPSSIRASWFFHLYRLSIREVSCMINHLKVYSMVLWYCKRSSSRLRSYCSSVLIQDL